MWYDITTNKARYINKNNSNMKIITFGLLTVSLQNTGKKCYWMVNTTYSFWGGPCHQFTHQKHYYHNYVETHWMYLTREIHEFKSTVLKINPVSDNNIAKLKKLT